MSITLDFLLLFILVVIPGLIFKRFYYLGEFSKQFSTKDSIYKSVFNSIVPGVIIQLLAYWVFIFVHEPAFSIKEIAGTFNEVWSFKETYSPFTREFVDFKIHLFLIHELNVMLLAAFLGGTSYWIIRGLKLDIRFKILRFKNQWYYVFSGEINSFKKFKNVKSSFIIELEKENRYKYYPPQVEIITQNAGEEQRYVGFLVDYDLSYENINDLDKVYLRRAAKITTGSNKKDEKEYLSGDVFVLKAHNILSLTLTFIPSPQNKQKEKRFNQQKKSIPYWIYNIGVTINVIIFLFIIFANLGFVNKVVPCLFQLLEDYSWFQRLLISVPINLFISLLLPVAVVEEENKPKKTNFLYKGKTFKEALLGKLLLIILFSALVYFLIL